ncbi:hypothetical protein F5J12DRAFT_785302 [Pisolithus orientalis]|uniref:uncharacterized protein n=1 Tax=Pisolithus orientalis TaxID=936130 RepID=UPI00222547D4|nr:uncharacterized protein F5J12DRAFT_785299 [Pisolithus orientalis]XP_051596798.1 uncharacterized protein F5J12DRAFT_785302 [Pisolithus orientalis]KAI5996881.1 hypothetical protein F5J12DRAFT_785299 [Pisolithus orientalis]KAI5996887.1 hypothetical protein F5J12DRAFT_785302 [Pisolithus orientalis]
MLTLRNKIKNLDVNVMLKMHEWVWKKKAIQTWFWTLRKVVMHHQKKSIKKVLEEAGIKQGSTEMIKSYQKAIYTVMKSLTAKEIQEAKALAKEWNEQQPPWDVQSEYIPFGNAAHHSQETELQRRKAVNMLRNLLRKCGSGTDAESPDKDATPWSKQRKSNGKPKTILLAPKLKDIMQTLVTFHYRKACRNSQFLPPEVPFKEPSQLTQDELTAILEWWQEQKEQHPNNMFGFKKWRDAGGNDGTGTSMVDEDTAEAVPLPDLDSQQWIAGCQVAEGDTCWPIAIGKEPPNAWWQVVGGNTSPVQPMPEGCHIDSPDSLCLADPLAVPTTIKRGHKQEDSKHKLPISLMSHTHALDQHRQCKGYVAIKMGVEGTKVA